MTNGQPVRLLVLLCLSVTAVIGCGSGSKRVGAGGDCVLNSECDNPLACKFMKCHHACNDSRDCDPGLRCVKVDGIGVCQLPAEAALVCGASVACSDPLVCGPDSKCRNSCKVKADCIGMQTCVTDAPPGKSVCADPSETLTPADGGMTDVPGGGTGGTTGTGGTDGGVDGTPGADSAADSATGTGGTDAGGGGTGGMDAGSGGAPGVDGGPEGGATAPLVLDVSTATNPVAPGQRLLYTMTVGNVSSHAVDGVKVLFRVPTGLQFNYLADTDPNTTCGNCVAGSEASWTLGTLAAGATETITVNASVLQNVGEGDSIVAPVTLTATGIVNPIMATKTVQVHGAPSAQLAMGTAYSPVTPGQAFTLDLDVGQIGTAALTGTELRASLPAGLTAGVISDGGTQPTPGVIVWAIGGLPVGAALHRTVGLTVDASVPAGSVLAAHATLTFDGGVAVDASADYPVSIVAAAPTLKVDVGVASSPVIPGGRLLYTATVTNVSPRAIDAVSVLLRTPTGTQFNYLSDVDPNTGCGNCVAGSEAYWLLGTIASGASETITVNALVVATAVGDGSLISAPITIRGTGVNDIHVTKTVQVFSRPAAQLALGTVANPVTPGQAFTFDLDVGQIGLNALAGTELRAFLPAGLAVGTISGGGTQPTPGTIVWSIGALAVGATLHQSVAVTVDAAAVPGTILSAHAALTYDGGNAVDALADYSVPVATAALPLKMEIVPSPSPAVPGMRLLYTATITNTSARAVDGVNLLFRVPFGLQFNYLSDADPDTGCGNCVAGSEAFWNLGTLVVGQIKIVTVNPQVLGTVLGGSLISGSMELRATDLTNPIWVQTTVPAHQ